MRTKISAAAALNMIRVHVESPNAHEALNITVNESSERASAIIALLTALASRFDVRIERLALLDLRNWNADCSRAARMLLSRTVARLDMSGTPTPTSIMSGLVGLPMLTLVELEMAHTRLTDAVFPRIRGALAHVRRLSLRENALTDAQRAIATRFAREWHCTADC